MPAAVASAVPPIQLIADKGTPFGDLLVPKLTASVKDGAVGVAVDDPVTVSAEDGVLGAVTMTNENGSAVAGPAEPRRPDLVDHRAARLQQALHASTRSRWASAARPAGR